MSEYILKTAAYCWDAIERGDKNFEIRRDDRGFQKGDVLVLRRLEKGLACDFYSTPPGSRFGTMDLRRRVLWILTGNQFGIEPGYVIMSLGPEFEVPR